MTARIPLAQILVASLALLGCTTNKVSTAGPHRFLGKASLPLTGDMAPFGLAFREGFEAGLLSRGDTAFVWSWEWNDNEGAPDLLQAWVDSFALPSGESAASLDLALGGLGGVTSGVMLDRISVPMLWMGDGTATPPEQVWSLWPTHGELLQVLSQWHSRQDTPSVALVLADGAWTVPFLDHPEAFSGLVSLPHDPGTRRWDREMGQILAMRPNTVVVWNRPEDAASFVARPLIAPFLAGRTVLLPEGAPAPAGAFVHRFRPLWQPSLPADSLQTSFLRAWGFQVGSALASASHQAHRHPTMPWFVALRSAACDSGRLDRPSGGWMPRLRIERDSM